MFQGVREKARVEGIVLERQVVDHGFMEGDSLLNLLGLFEQVSAGDFERVGADVHRRDARVYFSPREPDIDLTCATAEIQDLALYLP